MSVEKRDGVWVNTEVPDQTFASRDEARQASKVVRQAEETYAENLAVTEDTEAESFAGGFDREEKELSDGSVVRETAKEIRARENFVTMALYANTETARAYWRKRCEEEGYEVPEDGVSTVTV